MNLVVPAVTVEVQYLNPVEVESVRRQGQRFVLGAIAFGDRLSTDPDDTYPRASVSAPQLLAPSRVELWTSDVPGHYGQLGNITFAQNDAVLFGCLTRVLSESSIFEDVVRESYGEILSLLVTTEFRHLIRMWNYFPDIHAQCGALDRYQAFCRGRFEGIVRAGEELDQRMPAATAIGVQGEDLVVYFIAARAPGLHRDNPRQVAPYRYPPQYGPRSPSFARATSKVWDRDVALYVSGTASIVGHESRHPDSPVEQLDETLRNIRALLLETRDLDAPLGSSDFASIVEMKVYLRNPTHLSLVKRRLDALLPNVAPLYLEGEICRRELLMEIEAIARKPR